MGGPCGGGVSGVCGGWPDIRQALGGVWTGAGQGEGLPAVGVDRAPGSGRLGGRRVEIRLTCPGGERPRGPTPPRAGCYGPAGWTRPRRGHRPAYADRRQPPAGRPAQRWVPMHAPGVSASCGLWPVGRHSGGSGVGGWNRRVGEPRSVAGWATQCGATADFPRPAPDAASPRRRPSPFRYGSSPVALSVRHLVLTPRHTPRLSKARVRHPVGSDGSDGVALRPAGPPATEQATPAQVPLDAHVGGRGRLSEEI